MPKIRDVPLQEAEPGAPTSMLARRRGRRGAIKRTPDLEAAIGTRIRAARVAAGLSLTALATAVGVASQQIQKYEMGNDRVAASTLQGIAIALGVHPGSFFDDMPAPSGSVHDIRAALKAAKVLQQIRDPRVLKQLLALAQTLVNAGSSQNKPAITSDEDC